MDIKTSGISLLCLILLFGTTVNYANGDDLLYNQVDFDQKLETGPHFIKFFAPWCGHCKRLEPVWNDLAKEYNSGGKVTIAKVDCTTDTELCSNHGVTGYPTLKFYKNDEEPFRYRGDRDLSSLKKFIDEKLGDSGSDAKVESTEGLFDLTDDNFNTHTAKGNHFVKFYAPWCGHCKRLEPAWKELAKKFENNKQVTIARVDCTKSNAICTSNSVTGYPTLVWFTDGKLVEKYNRARDISTLISYVSEKTKGNEKEEASSLSVTNGLYEPTADEFTDHISQGYHFVKFYAPWCGHCKRLEPVWAELAKLYEEGDEVKISRVDCTKNSDICQSNDVKGYPTLIFFKDGKKVEEYPGKRDLSDLIAFVKLFVEGDSLEAEEDDDDKDEAASEEKKDVQCTDGLCEPTQKQFDDHISSGTHLVKFYAPWCGHCRKLEPAWKELAEFYKNSNSIQVDRVDCTVHKELCSEYEVRGYPTILMFNEGGKPEKYQGGRNIESLKGYLQKYDRDSEAEEEKEEVIQKEVKGTEGVSVDEGLYEPTGEQFDDHVSSGGHFIKFYAPWCGHCRNLEPAWKDLAKAYQDDSKVKISRVDCTKESDLCKKYGVRGYPTLLYFEDGENKEKYAQARDLNTLKSFLVSKTTEAQEQDDESDSDDEDNDEGVSVDEGLYEPTEEQFDDHVSSGGHFIKFYAPWCGHCRNLEPAWKDLAKAYQDDSKVKISRVDCTKESDLCKKYGVRGYPTLLYFEDGENKEKYAQARDLNTLKSFLVSKTTEAQEQDDEADSDDEDNDEGVSVDEGLYEPTGEQFDDHVSTGGHFIKFYAPWCGHCRNLEPAWKDLAKAYQDDSKVKISRVDCTKESDLCKMYGVRGYPTLLYFEDGENKEKYAQARDLDTLKSFLVSKTTEASEKDVEADSDDEDNDEGVSVDEGLYEPTGEQFDDHVSSGGHFIKFYAPWCGHCRNLEPAWKDLAKAYQDDSKVKISRVDCTKESDLCKKYGVRGYPTLLYFEDGENKEKYAQARDLNTLKSFLVSKTTEAQEQDDEADSDDEDNDGGVSVDEGLYEPTGEQFDDHVSSGGHFIKFYAPWCGHCRNLEPAWKDLAKAYQEDSKVKISRVDCTKESDLCKKHGVRGYPTLLYFEDGENKEKYSGGRSLDVLKEFLESRKEDEIPEAMKKDEL